MSDLQLFQNPEFGRVRIVEVDGEAWMVGKDVAEALGYSNPQKAIRDHVDEDDKTVNESFTVNGTQGALINESGLYSLVLSSKLPNARKFRRWVTTEVLPTVRRHGAYMTPETLQAAILNPDTMIQLCQQLKAEQKHSRQLEAENAAMLPKAVFADAVSASKSSILVGELAKLLRQNGVDTGEKRLFHWLRQNGYLIKRNGADHNMPTQRSIEQGLFVIKETTVCHADGHTTISKTPKVTGKGQQYFVNLHLRSM